MFDVRRAALVVAVLIAGGSVATIVPAQAQQQARPAQDPDLRAAIGKSNAYTGLLNRTLRAIESWERYTSWVNLKTGPTGRERYITYGLYSLYDVRDEIQRARIAIDAPPSSPELDAAMKRYIEAYEALAPVITQAYGYYERKDYKADNMAEGKALHVKLAPAAETFLRERKQVDALFRPFKLQLDLRELAALEVAEGKNAAWHIKYVMIQARNVVEILPTGAQPVANMQALDDAIARYAAAVKDVDAWALENPGKLSSFAGRPSSWLGKLREFRDKLARARGDARRSAGNDLTWITNDYNMMVSMSDMAGRMR